MDVDGAQLDGADPQLLADIERRLEAGAPVPYVQGQVGHEDASEVELPIRCFCEQRDHQVLQRDHANAKLH